MDLISNLASTSLQKCIWPLCLIDLGVARAGCVEASATAQMGFDKGLAVCGQHARSQCLRVLKSPHLRQKLKTDLVRGAYKGKK